MQIRSPGIDASRRFLPKQGIELGEGYLDRVMSGK
jgi:hypothetical protein